jgi:3-oxoacyl-[acyl-carrier-protein] synthase II
MKGYINGIGNISPQYTFDNATFLNEIASYDVNLLQSIEPDHKKYINPVKLRRMSRIIRIGLSSAAICMEDAAVSMPDAIITGTGFGCPRDTEKFLLDIIDNDEQQLTPTAFMQSTHNTISGQVAINIKCMNYNATYVNRGVSFERAMLDALMLLTEGNTYKNILVGGFDECTENHYIVMGRLGYWKSAPTNNLSILKSNNKGSIAGEGAQFFMVSSLKNEHTYALYEDLKTFYKANSQEEINQQVVSFLQKNNLKPADIDVVVLGLNGDVEEDKVHTNLTETLFNQTQQVYFKHLSGQYDTSSAFGTWVAAKMIKNQHIPDVIKVNSTPLKTINKVLIFNQHYGKNFSLQLLSKC